MSKQTLENLLSNTRTNVNNYSWKLYVFKLDKRNKDNPYFISNVNFRNTQYLISYAANLLSAIKVFQVDPIDTIQDYNGENTKVSCDKLQLDNLLIKDMWGKFNSRIANASEDKLEGKIAGYIVCGRPTSVADENLKPIIIIKFGNPVLSYKTKKTAVYRVSPTDNVLDAFEDEVYRLYLTADIIVHNNVFYAFNHSFEPIFNLKKTMDTIRQKAIERIAMEADTLSNLESFVKFARSYTSSRTFLTLDQSKISLIKNSETRIAIAESFKLQLDDNGKIKTDSEENVSLLIKFLCYKVIEEKLTNKILEVNNATEIQ